MPAHLVLIGDEDAGGRHLQYEYDAHEQTVGGEEAALLLERTIQADEADEDAREAGDDEQHAGAVEAARVYQLADLERVPQYREVLVVLRP